MNKIPHNLYDMEGMFELSFHTNFWFIWIFTQRQKASFMCITLSRVGPSIATSLDCFI